MLFFFTWDAATAAVAAQAVSCGPEAAQPHPGASALRKLGGCGARDTICRSKRCMCPAGLVACVAISPVACKHQRRCKIHGPLQQLLEPSAASVMKAHQRRRLTTVP